MTEAPPSLTALLKHGVQRLADAGVESPAREAWWIWDRVSGQPRAASVLTSSHAVPVSVAARFEATVARRLSGEPLAYALGETGFRLLTIKTDRRALIPRPETEGLVDLILRRKPDGRVIDVGTGTGCIALSLAREGHYDLVVGVDRSRDALALAAENVALSGLPVRLVLGDLTTMAGTGTFDIVVSNPPYVTACEHAELSPSVREWEPAEALVSGDDGMVAIGRLLEESAAVLNPGGWLVLEVDARRAELSRRCAEDKGWVELSLLDDLFGRARYLLARRSEQSDVG